MVRLAFAAKWAAITCSCVALFWGGVASCSQAQIPDLGIDASLHGARPFPADNPWNLDISQLPVDPNSANLIASIGLNTGLHPDFGNAWWNGAPNGIPYIVVAGNQTPVPVSFTWADQSDPGPYPIPANAPIEGGAASNGDRHVLLLDRDNWILYEMYNAWPNSAFTSWSADAGALFNLNSDALRPMFWTSADAAGLPIFAGLARADEVFEQGAILHALRFTAQTTRHAFTSPARHFASSNTSANTPPMGMRVRLKASFNIAPYAPQVQVILTALKTYGMILADNGSNWFISGAPDARWDDTSLHTLSQITGSNFEVVAMGDVITDLVSTPAVLKGQSGMGSATLSWSSALGATGYTLKRSGVSGGPYTAVASNMAATSYTDSALSGGTPYYYVVCGVCQTGQSPNSSEVSVTPSGASGGGGVSVGSVSLNPSSVTGGVASVGTVTLSGVAPSGGITVAVSSGNAQLATVPSSVTVASGQTSASFSVTTQAVAASMQVSLLASYGSTTQTATLTLQPSASTPTLTALTVSPSSQAGGSTVTGTVTLNSAASAGGAVVSLSSSSSSVASVPASVTVAAGQTSATFTISTSAVSASTNVTISASYAGGSQTATLQVQPMNVSSVTLSPSSVKGGTSSTGTVTLTAPAPSGGQVVSLFSHPATVATVPTSITVPAGQTSATFTITTSKVAVSTSVNINAAPAGTAKVQGTILTVTP